MDRWVEVLDPNGDIHFINPAQVVEITLHGGRLAQQGTRIVTTRGEITTADPESIERLRATAFAQAGLDTDGLPRRPQTY
jgi:hypothetical protein